MKHCLTLFALLIAVVLSSNAAEKPLPPPHFVPVNVPGADNTYVRAINNAGAMTGFYAVGNSAYHGFAMVGSRLYIISVPGAETYCTGINNSGQIVGYWANSKGTVQGFLYQNGVFTNIGPNTFYSSAYGINDLGQIVGGYLDNHDVTHGFVYDGTTYTTIDAPGANETQVTAINNSGLMVVQYTLPGGGGEHTALYDGTTFTNIDVPGAFDSNGYGINSNGDVALEWDLQGGNAHSAVLRAGTYYKFGYPGYNDNGASGINDYDQVVGVSATRQTSTGWELIP